MLLSLCTLGGLDLCSSINKSIKWIENYSLKNEGIVVHTGAAPLESYPEVTGYYIPTLLKYEKTDLALSYANYLLSIQNDNGSWNDPSGLTPYTFDTGMILKGLVELYKTGHDPEHIYLRAAIKGADWILTMQRDDGSIATPDYSQWNIQFGKQVPEAIHVYCLSPIRELAAITGNRKYSEFVSKALDFYLAKPDLTDFATLSHFNAYIIEGLIDVGQTQRAKRAMDLVALHQRLDGSVSGYSFVDFVCSTGLFQYAICWFKLGEFVKGQKAFEYALKLQNESGGWFGSYTVGRDKANYFPNSEISWAVKYFLDAAYYGCDYRKYKYAISDEDNIFDSQPADISELAIEYSKNAISYLKENLISEICIYGAGEICKTLLPILRQEGILVKTIFDRNASSYKDEYPSCNVIPYSVDAVENNDVILIASIGSKAVIERFINSTLGQKKVTVLKLEKQFLNRLGNYQYLKNSFITFFKECSNSQLCSLPLVQNEQYDDEVLASALAVPSLIHWGMKDKACVLGRYILSLQNADGSWSDDFGKNKKSAINTACCVNALYELTNSFISEKDVFFDALNKSLSYLSAQFENSVEEFFGCKEIDRLSSLCCGNSSGCKAEEKCSSLLLLGQLHNCITSSYSSQFISEKALSLYREYELKITESLENDLLNDVSLSCADYCVLAYSSLLCGCRGIAYLLLSQYEKKRLASPSELTASLFLCAISWFKLGNMNKGEFYLNEVFSLLEGNSECFVSHDGVCKQIRTSLFFKFYIDLLNARAHALNAKSCEALSSILTTDGRYSLLKASIRDLGSIDFLDLGCGKLRYTRRLIEEQIDNHRFYAVDFTKKIMGKAPECVNKKEGTILNIPYDNETFDFVFLSESLEHAVDIELALKEICRVLKSGGKVLVVDKDDTSDAKDSMADFEQWFSVEGLSSLMKKCGFKSVLTTSNLTKDNTPGYNFTGWLAQK